MSYNNIDEFLKAINPEDYDFSDEGASEEYQNMKGVEKYFNYKIATSYFVNLICVKDPDSRSNLLQEIYSLLWKEHIEKNERFYKIPVNVEDKTLGGKIQGETLNSVQTTFNVMYEFYEKPEHKIQRKQNISIKYMNTRYFCGIKKYKEDFSFVDDDFLNFLKTYHTLGNFMPIPVFCNGPRGTGHVKDYWDLTLYCIKNYYDSNKDEKWIKLILGEKGKKGEKKEEQINRYKNWLNSFGDWKKFVEKNFLEAFVKMDGIEPKEPKELWKGHFEQWKKGGYTAKDSALPGYCNDKNISDKDLEELAKKQCKEYFINATQYIRARSEEMIEKLKEICNT